MANITGTNGDDVLNGTEKNDVIVGLDGNDVLNGKGGKDVLVGNRGADKHNGGHGDDTIVWNNGDGSDTNDGGSGKDTQVVNGANAAGDAFEVRTGGNDFLFDRVNLVPFKLNDQNIEKLEVNGGGGHDSLKVFDLAGTDLKEIHFKGGAGNDSLDASATSVPVKAWGGDGHDKLLGGSVNDELNGDAGNDVLIGNRGSDKHNGGHGNDTIVWNNGDGSDFNNGGSGRDTQVVNGANAAGDEFVVKGTGNNSFVFDRVNLVPFKLTDKNIEKLDVSGGGGDDKLIVGNMNGSGVDKIFFKGGDGKDFMDASKSHVPVEASGGAHNDHLTGGFGDDVLKGDAGDDKLVGGKGHDKLFGGAGHDTFFVEKFSEIADFQHGIDKFFIV